MNDESKFDDALALIPYLSGLHRNCDRLREFVEWARKRDAAATELRDQLESMQDAFSCADNKYYIEDYGDPRPDAEAAIKKAKESEV